MSDNKIGRPRSRSLTCLSRVWLQTELDDTKSYYQLIRKITISEKRRIAKLWKKGKICIYVALMSTTVKMDLLVANWRAKNKSSVSQKRNQNLRGHPGGSSWLIKNRADFSLAENIQLLHGFFARTELFSGVSWRCFSRPRQPGEKNTEVKLGAL